MIADADRLSVPRLFSQRTKQEVPGLTSSFRRTGCAGR